MTDAMRDSWYSPGEQRGAAGGFFNSRLGRLGGGARPAAGSRDAGAPRVPVAPQATGASRWDNVEVTNLAADLRLSEGETIAVGAAFEDANRDAQLTFGFDANANPFDGTIAANAQSFAVAELQSGGPFTATLGTAGLAGNAPRFVYARITNGTRTRYYYAPGAVTVDPSTAAVIGRRVFYNRSAFDGNDAGANTNDDAAIAADKVALLPGITARFANYTSYSRGLNGIMVDIAGLPAGSLSASDFTFRTGNSNTPGNWVTPAVPTVNVRALAGGVSRVTLIWPDNAIRKQWLQVTVKSNANTGLAAPDVFYFGNTAGESGNSLTNAAVNFADEQAARAGKRINAALDHRSDYNRDRVINVADQLIARSNKTAASGALRLITVPPAGAALRPTRIATREPEDWAHATPPNSRGVGHPGVWVRLDLWRPARRSAAADAQDSDL
jgi:hypothetical protein